METKIMTPTRQPRHKSTDTKGAKPLNVEHDDLPPGNPNSIAEKSCGTMPMAGSARTRPRSFWRESLAIMEKHVALVRRKVRADERVYLSGEPFDTLFLVNSGLFRLDNLAYDGREQSVGIYLKGDWLGFDGIATGRHACSAIALDSGEVWTIRYDTLLQESPHRSLLMRVILAAMSAQMTRNRDAMLSMGTLLAEARVADFLLQWSYALAERGLRTDQINVHMTRADMGNHLGLTLESVSRALSKLARSGVIRFEEKGRRDISIPNLAALRDFIQKGTGPGFTAFQ